MVLCRSTEMLRVTCRAEETTPVIEKKFEIDLTKPLVAQVCHVISHSLSLMWKNGSDRVLACAWG